MSYTLGIVLVSVCFVSLKLSLSHYNQEDLGFDFSLSSKWSNLHLSFLHDVAYVL